MQVGSGHIVWDRKWILLTMDREIPVHAKCMGVDKWLGCATGQYK